MTEKISNDPEYILEHGLKLHSQAEAEDFLYRVLPNSPKALFMEGDGFNRSTYFMRELGNPQDQFRSVHIAGTSGKGSTSYFISGLLIAHGFSVGTHVSPHMYDLRERSMLNLELPSESQFLTGINEMMPIIKKMEHTAIGRPTFFEVTLANAAGLFARERVDYGVIETGLGGRYDSTNTITRADKLAVITKIGLDHTDVLGDTVGLIAYQKAGILPYGGKAITVAQTDEAKSVISSVARERGDDLSEINTEALVENVRITLDGVTFDYNDNDIVVRDCVLPTLAAYQVENAVMAIQALRQLAARDGFELSPDKIRSGLLDTAIPGRCEIRRVNGLNFLLDGAHNPQKMAGLIDSLAGLDLAKKPIWVIGAKKGKDIEDMLRQVIPYADKLIFSEFFNDLDNEQLKSFPISSLELKDLADSLSDKSLQTVAYERPVDSLRAAQNMAEDGQLIIVTGSIYFLGDANKWLQT